MDQINKVRETTMQRSNSNAIDSIVHDIDLHSCESLEQAKGIINEALFKYQCFDIITPVGARPLIISDDDVSVVDSIDLQIASCDYLKELGVNYGLKENILGNIEVRRVFRIQPAIRIDVAHCTFDQSKDVIIDTISKHPDRNVRVLTGIQPVHTQVDISNHICTRIVEWLMRLVFLNIVSIVQANEHMRSCKVPINEDPGHPGALIIDKVYYQNILN